VAWAGNGDVTTDRFGAGITSVFAYQAIINRRLSAELKSTHIEPNFIQIPRLEASVGAGRSH
jgi:hypothetical protein